MSNTLASITIGNTPPINPSTNAVWISTAKKDLRIPHSPNEHKVALAPGVGQGTQAGTTYTWESTAIQEPDVFYNPVLSRYEMYYSAFGGGIGHAWATSVEGPWTRTSSTGAANIAGIYHHTTYVEGTTIYLYGVDSATNLLVKCYTASTSTPQTLTLSGTVFNTTISGGILMGNFNVIFVDGVYRAFFDHSYNSQSWQEGIAECSTPTGTFAVKTPAMGTLLPTWFNGIGNAAGGGSKMFVENGEYVQYYHAIDRLTGGSSAPSSDGFIATAPDGINWTVQNQGNPILRRCHPYEVDQIADLMPVDMVGGGTHLFWSAIANVPSTSYIMHGQLSPQMKVWSGYEWQVINPAFDPLNPPQLRITPQKTAIYTASNLDDVSMDPGATANMAFTLPRASVGAQVRVVHSGTGAGTILVGCNASDTLLTGSAATLSTGQWAHYRCYVQNRWNRIA